MSDALELSVDLGQHSSVCVCVYEGMDNFYVATVVCATY